jgi:plastocyanin
MVVTFDEPGFFPYYCLLHGTRGGVGMAASITVVEAGSGETPVQNGAPAAPTEPLAEPTEAAAPTGPEPTQPPSTPAEAPTPTEEPAAAPLTFEIDMLDFTYSELSLEIPAGSTILWSNAGAFKHSATADDGSWDTGLLDPNGVASITYDKPGVYPYYCTLHGAPGGVGMAGTITVR